VSLEEERDMEMYLYTTDFGEMRLWWDLLTVGLRIKDWNTLDKSSDLDLSSSL
jgi:hypothetical protein